MNAPETCQSLLALLAFPDHSVRVILLSLWPLSLFVLRLHCLVL